MNQQIPRDDMSDMSHTPVTVCVAMSESGTFLSAFADTHWLQEEKKHQELLKQVREGKQLWTVRYIRTSIQYPISNEVQPYPHMAARIKELECENETNERNLNQLTDELADARRENAELRKDAERLYRHIKHMDNKISSAERELSADT